MATKQEFKERMRLYEMYSSAVLNGFSSSDLDWSTDHMLKQVDKTTKAMIEYHFVYSLECDDE
jgi:hypothetical protein